MENGTNLVTKVVAGKVRFSYVNVFEPRSINGGRTRYSISLIIGKSDLDTIGEINSAILQAEKDGLSMFGGRIPDNLKLPLRDGDVEKPGDEAYRNSFFLNATSMKKPIVVDRDMQCITGQGEFYSGCYGRASIFFCAFSHGDSKGITCRLLNLQKISDGVPLAITSSVEDDFTPVSEGSAS
jgi:hypothetical protein